MRGLATSYMRRKLSAAAVLGRWEIVPPVRAGLRTTGQIQAETNPEMRKAGEDIAVDHPASTDRWGQCVVIYGWSENSENRWISAFEPSPFRNSPPAARSRPSRAIETRARRTAKRDIMQQDPPDLSSRGRCSPLSVPELGSTRGGTTAKANCRAAAFSLLAGAALAVPLNLNGQEQPKVALCSVSDEWSLSKNSLSALETISWFEDCRGAERDQDENGWIWVNPSGAVVELDENSGEVGSDLEGDCRVYNASTLPNATTSEYAEVTLCPRYCRVYGEECGSVLSWDRQGEVLSIYFAEKNLTGAIPPALANLSKLETLVLDENQLTGKIPSSLGRLSNLKHLQLRDNRLTGGIPSSLGSLSNLEHLALGHNQLTGKIPSELGGLSNLVSLQLGDNQLTGGIPSSSWADSPTSNCSIFIPTS